MSKKFFISKFEGYAEVGEGESVPMFGKLSLPQFKVLSAIAMYQTEGGVCDSSIGQLVEISCLSKPTVMKTIVELENFRYAGKPVLVIDKVPYRGKVRNVYTLLENPLFAVFGEKVEINGKNPLPINELNGKNPLPITEFNGKDSLPTIKELITKKELNKKGDVIVLKNKEIIGHFCKAYENKYFDKYKIVWGRDNKFTTKFKGTVEDLSPEQVFKLIDIVVDKYDSWSTNTSKYPLSLNSLSLEWIQSKARKILEEEENELSRMEEQNVEVEEKQKQSIQNLFARLKKGENQ